MVFTMTTRSDSLDELHSLIMCVGEINVLLWSVFVDPVYWLLQVPLCMYIGSLLVSSLYVCSLYECSFYVFSFYVCSLYVCSFYVCSFYNV
jgi:hypothetical protein